MALALFVEELSRGGPDSRVSESPDLMAISASACLVFLYGRTSVSSPFFPPARGASAVTFSWWFFLLKNSNGISLLLTNLLKIDNN